jgi:hypothetical protein
MPWLYRTYNYGPVTTDISKNFEATAIYELPFGKGKHWVSSGKTANIIGGWQISGLLSDYTGLPFSVTSSTSLNANNSYNFGNCIAQPIKTQSVTQWYNISTFAPGTTTAFGNCGQNTLRGPGLVNADLSLTKKFAFRERWNFAFVVDMFNVGNEVHRARPGYTVQTSNTTSNKVGDGLFMDVSKQIANTGRDGLDQRTLRLSMKVTF